MKTVLIMALLAGVAGSPVSEGNTITAQQQRMTTCNQQATAQTIKGDERKTYMNNCLKNSESQPADKSLTPQQQKMKLCNSEADIQILSNDARKTFISNCLKQQPK